MSADPRRSSKTPRGCWLSWDTIPDASIRSASGRLEVEMDASELHTDGNGIAGLLQQVFAGEITTVRRVCDECGDEYPIGSGAACHQSSSPAWKQPWRAP